MSSSSPSSLSSKEKELEDLVKSIQTLNLKDSANKIPSKLTTDLILNRHHLAFERRRARNALWLEGNRREAPARIEFNEKMDLFPELVWGNILKQLRDPRDKLVASNMTMLWWDLLKRERTHFLFHEVFPVIHKSGHLPGNDVLKCRAVCREWRAVVDNCIQNSFPTPSISLDCDEDSSITDGREVPGLDMFFIGDFPEIAQFNYESEHNYTGSNPFPSRKLTVGWNVETDLQFLPEMHRILGRWGGELWKLIISLDNAGDVFIFYEEIVKLLRLTPNLKTFGIMFGSLIDDGGGSNERGRVGESGMDLRTEWRLRMEITSPPDLPCLTSLIALNLPVALIQEFLGRYGPTLEYVTVGGKGVLPVDLVGGTRLPRLKQMCIPCDFTPRMNEEIFSVNWPQVESFGMIYHSVKAADIPKIFENLSGLGPSLRNLALTLQNEEGSLAKLDDQTMKTLSLNLPHVEKFTLSVTQVNLKNIDFLLPMSNLKELVLNYTKFVNSFQKDDDKKKKAAGPPSADPKTNKTLANFLTEIIQFSSFTGMLYESNIWRIFPELRKVTIVVRSILKVKKHQKGQERDDDEDENNMLIKTRSYCREGYVHHHMMLNWANEMFRQKRLEEGGEQ